MVIANSDSNTTLVSLNENGDGKYETYGQKIVVAGDNGLLRYVDQAASLATHCQSFSDNPTNCSDGGIPTELLISDCDTSSSSSGEENFPLYLPSEEHRSLSQEFNVDEYISRNYYNINKNENDNHQYQIDFGQPKATSTSLPGAEILKKSRERLLATKCRSMRSGASRGQDGVLYVAQGERANSTSEQYDVMMSDKATTCHILAFRSKTKTNDVGCDGDLPLTSLTHLDGSQYEECVREMIEEHLDYHHLRQSRKRSRKRPKFVEEEKKSDESSELNDWTNFGLADKIIIDVHVMGGFNDMDSSSSSITNWLMRLLAQMAQEFKDQQVGVQLVVKTLMVSSSNNEVDNRSNNSPIGRGFGIDLKTGEVFLTDNKDGATANSNGPTPVLRSVRLWSRCGHYSPPRLSIVHRVKDVTELWASFGVSEDDDARKEYNFFWVQPFQFRLIPDVDLLLGLPDDLLLQYTSTSPDVEDAGFCDEVRASMQFLKQRCVIEREDGRSYFGKSFDQPMVFAMGRRNSKDSDGPKLPNVQQREWKLLSM